MKKLLLSVFAAAAFSSAWSQCNELFISEYVEGSGNNKALEIYNPTNAPINLSGYSVVRYANGATTAPAGYSTPLTGTIAPFGTFVIVNGQTTTSAGSPACDPALQAMADQLDGAYPAPTYMNGNDAIALEKAGVQLDIFGKIGEDPGVSWTDVFPYNDAAGAYWTKDHTLQRKASITQGVTTNPTAFDVTVQWDSLPVNTWSGLGTHTCDCQIHMGVNETDNAITLVAYPNPSVNGYINLAAGEEIISAEVFNMIGQQVFFRQENMGKNMSFATSDLPKGVYTVRIRFVNGKTGSVRFSIQ